MLKVNNFNQWIAFFSLLRLKFLNRMGYVVMKNYSWANWRDAIAGIQAVLLGYVWGFFGTELMLESIEAFRYLLLFYPMAFPFLLTGLSPFVLPLLQCAQYALPIFIAFGIYPKLKNAGFSFFENDMLSWVVAPFTMVRALLLSRSWFRDWKLERFDARAPVRVLHAIMSALFGMAQYTLDMAKLDGIQPVNFSWHPLRWLWSVMQMLTVVVPAYALFVALCPTPLWAWMWLPTLSTLVLGALITQAPRPLPVTTSMDKEDKGVAHDVRSVFKNSVFLVAHIAVFGQFFVFSHVLASSMLSLPFIPVMTASVHHALYCALRLFAQYGLLTEEAPLVVAGAENLYASSAQLLDVSNEQVSLWFSHHEKDDWPASTLIKSSA